MGKKLRRLVRAGAIWVQNISKIHFCFDKFSSVLMDSIGKWSESHVESPRKRKCFESFFNFRVNDSLWKEGRGKKARKTVKIVQRHFINIRRNFLAFKNVCHVGMKNEKKAGEVERGKHFTLSGNYRDGSVVGLITRVWSFSEGHVVGKFKVIWIFVLKVLKILSSLLFFNSCEIEFHTFF